MTLNTIIGASQQEVRLSKYDPRSAEYDTWSPSTMYIVLQHSGPGQIDTTNVILFASM